MMPNTFGELIRSRRKYLNLTQSGLAASIGVTSLWLTDGEQGRTFRRYGRFRHCAMHLA